jgi:hypothetical protein
MTGDLMAEDPLCTHTPGTFAGAPLLTLRGHASSGPRRTAASAVASAEAEAERGDGGPASAGDGRSGGATPRGLIIEYGPESPTGIAWDDEAALRMKKIPAFVRGMVVNAVEESCRKSGLDRVTIEVLEQIRARMPTPKLFG